MWITCSSRTSDKGRGFASRVGTAGRTILIGVTSYILIAASYPAFVPTARPQLPSFNGDMGHGHHLNCPATPSFAITSGLGQVVSGAPPAEGPLVSYTHAVDNRG